MRRRLVKFSALAVTAFAISCLLVIIAELGTYVSYGYVREGGRLGGVMAEDFHGCLDSGTLDRIPDGESLISDLPKEVRDELLFMFYMPEDYTDSWQNPYRIVSEQRNGGRWFGIFSTGRDGFSESKGNDPDDINSWGQNGFDYYPKVIARHRLIDRLRETSLIFLLVAPVCLLIYKGVLRLRARKVNMATS